MGTRPAAREDFAVIEQVGDVDPATGKIVNPNGVKRLRYADMLDVYHRKGTISDRGHLAATYLRDAWDRTQRSAPAIQEIKVDHSPKPDANIAIMVDRVSALVAVTMLIPRADAQLLHAVVCCGNPPGWPYRGRRYAEGLERLRAALDRLADRLRL